MNTRPLNEIYRLDIDEELMLLFDRMQSFDGVQQNTIGLKW